MLCPRRSFARQAKVALRYSRGHQGRGPPSVVIDGIRSIEAKYPGLESFMIHWAEGIPPEEFKEQLRWFAKDVMPAFR